MKLILLMLALFVGIVVLGETVVSIYDVNHGPKIRTELALQGVNGSSASYRTYSIFDPKTGRNERTLFIYGPLCVVMLVPALLRKIKP